MTATPLEHPLPPGRGAPLFGAIGYAIRGIKALPVFLRERALDAVSGGVSANLPPFADILRLVETAKGVPDGKRWQARLLAEKPKLQSVRIRDIVDDSKGLRARLYLPRKGAPTPSAALVWVHGGAFIIGSLDAREAHWPSIELAASGIPVLSVGYRMCIGGVHYPAPHDDVLTAWRWACNHADEIGVDPSRLHLGGGSAGGCLAASVALRLRDAGESSPASLYLAYPVLEGDLPPPTPEMAAGLSAAKLPADGWVKAMFANWAGAARWDHPYVSPGLADPSGLPPTYVLTCGRDALRRSSQPYVRRLEDAGVTVWEDVLPDAEHAPLDRPGTPDGERALARLRTWLLSGESAMHGRQTPMEPVQ